MAFLFSNQSFPMRKNAWVLRRFPPTVICSYHERKIKTWCKGLYSVDSLWWLLIRKRTEDGASPFLIFPKATTKPKRGYVQQVLHFCFSLFVLTKKKIYNLPFFIFVRGSKPNRKLRCTSSNFSYDMGKWKAEGRYIHGPSHQSTLFLG